MHCWIHNQVKLMTSMKENIFNLTYGQSIISSNNFLIKQMVIEKQLFNRTDGQVIIDHESQIFVILPLSRGRKETNVLDQYNGINIGNL